MAVTVDATGTAVVGDTNTVLTFNNLTITASGTALLAYLTFFQATPAPTSVAATWNSVALTQITTVTGATGQIAQLWGLASPTTGNHTLSVSWTNTAFATVDAMSFKGTASTFATIFKNAATNTGSSATASVSVTVSAGDFGAGCFSLDAGAVLSTNQTQFYVDNANSVCGGNYGTATGTFSGTLDATRSWAAVGCDIAAAVTDTLMAALMM